MILVDSILKSNNFALFANLNLIDQLRNEIHEISKQSENFNANYREKIMEIIFENKSFFKREKGTEDFISSQSKFNSLFKELKISIDNIK